jgi:hypothetical protein
MCAPAKTGIPRASLSWVRAVHCCRVLPGLFRPVPPKTVIAKWASESRDIYSAGVKQTNI